MGGVRHSSMCGKTTCSRSEGLVSCGGVVMTMTMMMRTRIPEHGLKHRRGGGLLADSDSFMPEMMVRRRAVQCRPSISTQPPLS
jgi:uncharacterized phosphosugar-binding protein